MGVDHRTPGCCAARFDYSTLPVEHADAARLAAERIKVRTSAAVLDTGRDLIGIKSLLDHGQFGHWLRVEFAMTPRTAQNYMRAVALAEAKSETVSHLPAGTVYEIARAPAAVQDCVLERLGTGEIDADQVRPALRAAARALRQGGTVGQGDVGPTQRQAVDPTDPEPIHDADLAAQLAQVVSDAVTRLAPMAATILEATKAVPGSDDRWAAFCRALRVGLEHAVAPPAPTTPVQAWRDLRDAAIGSSRITKPQRIFLATLGERGEPTVEQIAKLMHIVGVVT